jgi:hypothetical protein
MNTFRRCVLRFLVGGAAAMALVAGPAALFVGGAPQASADNCYNGVLPWGPYVPSCTVPGPQGVKIPGSAPDANAIIACRHHPGCLSWYVNGP